MTTTSHPTSGSASLGASTANELEHLGFKQVFTEVNGLKLCAYTNLHSSNELDKNGGKQNQKKTILVLLHGYPQS